MCIVQAYLEHCCDIDICKLYYDPNKLTHHTRHACIKKNNKIINKNLNIQRRKFFIAFRSSVFISETSEAKPQFEFCSMYNQHVAEFAPSYQCDV